MNNPYFTQSGLWRIPQAAIEDSLDEMAIDGIKGTEGIVLWLGKDSDDTAVVTHLIRLRGSLVVKRAPKKLPAASRVIPLTFWHGRCKARSR